MSRISINPQFRLVSLQAQISLHVKMKRYRLNMLNRIKPVYLKKKLSLNTLILES